MLNSTILSEASHNEHVGTLNEIERLDAQFAIHFNSKFSIQSSLNRSLVSFQANKMRPIYRWYKYKEGFSAALVEYLFQKYQITRGCILDPFAGSGTALFAANALGIDADGIELLPIGQQIIQAKQLVEAGLTPDDIDVLARWSKLRLWQHANSDLTLPELRITQGAYSEQTKASIERYLSACQQESWRVQKLLRFALLCVLESISYTRKDGQYLRWDYRAGRRQGIKPFDKGKILSFEQAISDKINEILNDITNANCQSELFASNVYQGKLQLFAGSCLDIMPKLPSNTYDAIITSPPYCNRYDYTRTYALELALLGIDEKALVQLRQDMLSCTVENRTKDLLDINPDWVTAINVTNEQMLLQAILSYLDNQKSQGILNNNGIPRMVKGYFYEMACILAECTRVMKPDALLLMVNDNVRYAGASISVDMILSSIAEQLGLSIENILVLPQGKGNSSQQMGEHGRESLRKCVYVWRKK